MKELCILGSTGSIGTQTLEVVAANPQEWRVRVLVAHHNVARMAQQIEAFRPDFAVLTDSTAAQKLQHLCPHTEILTGTDGLMAAATYGPVHTVLAAMVGYAGLRPTLAAIKSGKMLPWPIRKPLSPPVISSWLKPKSRVSIFFPSTVNTALSFSHSAQVMVTKCAASSLPRQVGLSSGIRRNN